MADTALRPRSPLAAFPGHAVNDQGGPEPGVRLTEQPAGWTFAVLARAGQAAMLRDRARIFGIKLPEGPRRAGGRDGAALGIGPDRWLIQAADETIAKRLNASFASVPALCSTVPLDDERIVIAVSGEKSRDTLSKVVTVDLHPRAFRPGDVAVTSSGGIPLMLWLRDDADVFELAVPRSMARDAWHWLIDSAAEYGCTAEQASEAPNHDGGIVLQQQPLIATSASRAG